MKLTKEDNEMVDSIVEILANLNQPFEIKTNCELKRQGNQIILLWLVLIGHMIICTSVMIGMAVKV